MVVRALRGLRVKPAMTPQKQKSRLATAFLLLLAAHPFQTAQVQRTCGLFA